MSCVLPSHLRWTPAYTLNAKSINDYDCVGESQFVVSPLLQFLLDVYIILQTAVHDVSPTACRRSPFLHLVADFICETCTSNTTTAHFGATATEKPLPCSGTDNQASLLSAANRVSGWAAVVFLPPSAQQKRQKSWSPPVSRSPLLPLPPPSRCPRQQILPPYDHRPRSTCRRAQSPAVAAPPAEPRTRPSFPLVGCAERYVTPPTPVRQSIIDGWARWVGGGFCGREACRKTQ